MPNPGLKRVHRLGDDFERHVRVLMPAELRALAAIDAGFVRLDPRVGHDARNQIALAHQVRHPEAVNDVRRHRLDDDREADGNVQLVRAGEDIRWRDVVVLKVPPPLMPDDIDGHGAGPARRVDAAARDDTRRRDADEDHDRQRHGDRHVPRQAPGRLGLIVDLASPSAEGDEQRDHHDEVDGDRHQQQPPAVRGDAAGNRPVWIEHGLISAESEDHGVCVCTGVCARRAFSGVL